MITKFDLLADRATQYLLHPGDGAVETQRTGLDDLSAGEREKLVGQQAGTLGCQLDLFHVPERLFPLRPRSSCCGGGQLFGNERCVVQNDGQKVVEVVRDASRELPKAFQTL